jgi:ABC-2 type transport system permease protein
MLAKGRGELRTPLALETRSWYNQGLRSQNVLIPGIIALVMIVVAALLTSTTIAKEWENGTMEQLIATPLRGPELIFGKVIPYLVIGLVDVALAVLMGRWVFDVAVVGNTALLFLMSTLFLIGALFFGLTLSIKLKSQVLANQLAIVAGFLPTLLLSGFVFAIENMPLPLQFLTYIVPARYFIAILRGIYLKGIGLEILWLNALFLLVYALLMVVAANKKFSFKLE